MTEPARSTPPRPRLVVGLGNTLAGDDGIGAHIAEALRIDARLPDDVDVVEGGTDLLRVAPLLHGRSEVLLIDATLGETAGATRFVRASDAELAYESPHAHWLSAPGALELLRSADESFRETHFSWLLVEVESTMPGDGLSPQLAPRVAELATLALAALAAI